MKLKNLLPFAFAFTVQFSSAQTNTPDLSPAERRDSVDNVIKAKITKDFEQSRQTEDDFRPLSEPIDQAALKDTVHYRRFDFDPDSRLQPDYFDLRKEIAANKNTKLGFVYQAPGAGNNPDAAFFVSMENAQEIVRSVDKDVRNPETDSAAVYFRRDWAPEFSFRRGTYLMPGIERLDKPAYTTGVVISSRMAEAIDENTLDFSTVHEGAHKRKFTPYPFLLKTVKEWDAVSDQVADSLRAIMEYGADDDAARTIGYDNAQKALTTVHDAFRPRSYDHERVNYAMTLVYPTQEMYKRDGDHPSIAQRKYFLYLCEMFDANKSLRDVIEPLVPAEAMPIWKMKYGNK